jgi:catechol-2,3-dioxygenase
MTAQATGAAMTLGACGGQHLHPTADQEAMSVPGPLSDAHAVTKLPAQDLDRARRFYHDKLGLDPIEEREGGLRFICAGTEFHLFSSSGAASGASTQMGFEVSDLEAVIEDLRRRGLTFEAVEVPGFPNARRDGGRAQQLPE